VLIIGEVVWDRATTQKAANRFNNVVLQRFISQTYKTYVLCATSDVVTGWVGDEGVGPRESAWAMPQTAWSIGKAVPLFKMVYTEQEGGRHLTT
jgi:hypothetical protein